MLCPRVCVRFYENVKRTNGNAKIFRSLLSYSSLDGAFNFIALIPCGYWAFTNLIALLHRESFICFLFMVTCGMCTALDYCYLVVRNLGMTFEKRKMGNFGPHLTCVI